MSVVDDLAASLKKALEVARERGNEAITMARLRAEMFSLNREREALYGRLGKSYFESNGDALTLEPFVAELHRVSGELAAREEALKHIGASSETGSGTAVAVLEPTAADQANSGDLTKHETPH